MMQNRTHTCGELRLTDAGKQVKIVGWMENVRVVSASLAFIVVRDFYGTTQVVAETEDIAYVASEECAIRVMASDVTNVWSPRGGEPVIFTRKGGRA